MSSRAAARARVGLIYAFLAVVMSVLVACVTVAREPDPSGSTEAAAVVAVASPSPAPTPEVVAPTPEVVAPTPEVVAPTPEVVTEPLTSQASGPPSPQLVPATAEPLEPTPTATALVEVFTDSEVASADLALDEKTVRRLDNILRNTVKNQGVVGVQAAVRLPSGATWTGTAGNAELTPDRPIEQDTQFAIASVTKTFVAALILQLAEEGKVDLDSPFGTYFDDAPRSKTVTLRQLLSHTSGIYNYFEHPRYTAAARAWWESPDAEGLRARDHEWTYEEIMDLVKSGYSKPGDDYHYSNTNYVILGRVAEAVEGKPLHKQLRQRFFKPLGLEDTVYQPAEKPRRDAAHGHWNYGDRYTDHTRDSNLVPFMAAVSVADAAGAIASTAEDLAMWAEKLYGGEVLSEASLAEMTTFLRPGAYGLGTDVASFAGKRGHGHRGGLRGFESSMWYFPQSGVSVALISNQGNWLTDTPMEKLVRAAHNAG